MSITTMSPVVSAGPTGLAGMFQRAGEALNEIPGISAHGYWAQSEDEEWAVYDGLLQKRQLAPRTSPPYFASSRKVDRELATK